jgi:hypothetical protein
VARLAAGLTGQNNFLRLPFLFRCNLLRFKSHDLGFEPDFSEQTLLNLVFRKRGWGRKLLRNSLFLSCLKELCGFIVWFEVHNPA